MEERIIIRRRNRLKKHFVNVSNVLLYGYKALSDAAKITYQVIEGFDWEDKETGDSKGFVFPAIEAIAEIRNASKRTVFRHIQELEKIGLLSRVRQRNKPSILYIEEVSDEEANAYLNRYVDKQKPVEAKKQEVAKLRNAKNGTSEEAREMPKMALAYMKENEKKENEINVKENLKISEGKNDEQKRSGMQGINDILKRFDAVNFSSVQKNKISKKTLEKQKPEEKVKRDYFANEIATELNDEKSLGCYRVIAEKVPQTVIFEKMASVKELWKDGKIKKSRGALFVDLIKTYCEKKHIDLDFSEPSQNKKAPFSSYYDTKNSHEVHKNV